MLTHSGKKSSPDMRQQRVPAPFDGCSATTS
jgi:hypothetical protein